LQSTTERDLILVTGGTGTLGRLVVPQLRAAGRPVRVLSRKPHDGEGGVEHVVGDLEKDVSIEPAVRDAVTIVHLAGTQKRDEVKAENLVRAARAAGRPHLVYISVVGADRVPVSSPVDRAMFGYFASKLAAERVIADSGLPWTTVRATQFHDLLLTTVQQMAKLPVIPVASGIRFQPIDTDEVAKRIVELALGEPAGLAADMGGPDVLEMKAIVRSYLSARGKHRLTMPMRPPGKAAQALRDGANLAPGRAVGHRTWDDFLAERVA